MAAVVEWDKNGWHSTRPDGCKLTYGIGLMVASHPDKNQRCLIVVIGPLSIGLSWFTRRN